VSVSRSVFRAYVCNDCPRMLHTRSAMPSLGGGWSGEWFMVKARVWQEGQRKGRGRFLCVGCLEDRIGRKLVAADFSRSAKVNFAGDKPLRLRRRMKGLKPARRLIETRFKT
jgi:hypothetical protein